MPLKTTNTYSDPKLAKSLLKEINKFDKDISLMEVCGTHTVQIFKTGIKSGLNKNIHLLSGPGCPVCVTSIEDIDKAIEIAATKDAILCCFGDMVNVPGSHTNLAKAKGERSAHVKMMYSPLEALEVAKNNPNKLVVMFGVGFETTIPAFASVLVRAREQKIKNLFIFPVFKLIPPAIRTLLESREVNIDGFILPGHVSVVIGTKPYQFIVDEFKRPAVVTGFETIDILDAILWLIDMKKKDQPKVTIEYDSSVDISGNKLAKDLIYKVFKEADVKWRGLGEIKGSGLKLKDEFKSFDVDSVLDIKVKTAQDNPKCLCANVIKGVNTPLDCKLFKEVCKPGNPIGPCMVSSEGTCAAYYKYGD